MNKIIVHSGQAHFDEFLAVALILATYPNRRHTICRRDATDDELRNPNVWVVDVGGEYFPEARNFDHHQNGDLGAAFILVADYLGVDLGVTAWADTKSKLDTKGPFAVAKDMGCDDISPLFSPLEFYFVKLFEGKKVIDDKDALYPFIKDFGKNIITYVKGVESRQREIKELSTVETVKGHRVLFLEDDNTEGLQLFRDRMYIPASMSVTFDDRTDGYALYRFNDTPGVDFSKLEGNETILFAHKNGFIAKTKERISRREIMLLLSLATERVDNN